MQCIFYYKRKKDAKIRTLINSLSYDFILYNIIYAAINSWKDDSIVYNLKQTLQLLIESQVMVNNKRVVVYF